MDWYLIGAAGSLAGLAGALAKLIERWTSRTVGFIAFGVLLVAFQTANQTVVGPWLKNRRLESEVLSSPLYKALRDVDSATYEAAVETIRRGQRDGKGQQQVVGEVQELLNSRLAYYLSMASDDAVLQYYSATVRRFEDLSVGSPWLCHNLIIGKNSADLSPT